MRTRLGLLVKAVVCGRYGPPDVLQLREVEKPTPKNDEVLVRVHAASVSMGDCELRGLNVPFEWKLLLRIGFGIRAPRKKILGQELAGEIESTGRDVTRFKKGDQVFALTGLHLGAYAEYDCLKESAILATKPASMSYEEAAVVPAGGLHAINFLRRANIQPGQEVLIRGAGGSIGTVAVQLAKSYGATVTGVDRTSKLDMIRSIGADHVVDYTTEDFTKNGKTYDVIFDTVGRSSFSALMNSLKTGGYLLLGNPSFLQLFRGIRNSGSAKKVMRWTGAYPLEDLVALRELVETGKLRSVIDRRYPLEQVAEAHRYVDTGQKKGNVVITVGHNDRT
jgi:NADPH:quinone reductase-like Zn-dependent oxidoreductase